MKTILKISGLVSLLFGAVACKKDTNKFNINYPAAYVINGGASTISVINLNTNEVAATVNLNNMPMSGMSGHNMCCNLSYPHHINISPDKNQLAIGVPGMDMSGGHHGGMAGMMGRLLVINSTTCEVLSSNETPAMNHNCIFTPNGTEIWTAMMQDSGTCCIYNASSYSLINTVKVGMMPAEVTISANGLYGFVANGESNDVTVIRIADKTVVATIPVGLDPVGAWAGADNKMYVDNETGQSISVIDVDSMRVVETISLGFTPGFAAYNSLLNELWITHAGDNKVSYFQRMNNAWMAMGDIVTGNDAHAIAFTNNGTTAYITNQGAGTVSVINTQTKTKIKDITVGSKPNGIVLKQ